MGRHLARLYPRDASVHGFGFPMPTEQQVLAKLMDEMISSLEREERRADLIADGCSLYDEEFYRIDARARKQDDERGAFEFYPGEKLWEISTTQSEYVTE